VICADADLADSGNIGFIDMTKVRTATWTRAIRNPWNIFSGRPMWP
jgi:hypothetical protein